MNETKQQISCHAFQTIRLFLFLLCSVGLLGCGEKKLPELTEYTPPTAFMTENVAWTIDETGPNDSDNEIIGRFFEENPDLMNSPDWTGQPSKYSAEFDQVRFYWFSGNNDSPIWNGLEVNRGSVTQFSGQGPPGSNN